MWALMQMRPPAHLRQPQGGHPWQASPGRVLAALQALCKVAGMLPKPAKDANFVFFPLSFRRTRMHRVAPAAAAASNHRKKKTGDCEWLSSPKPSPAKLDPTTMAPHTYCSLSQSAHARILGGAVTLPSRICAKYYRQQAAPLLRNCEAVLEICSTYSAYLGTHQNPYAEHQASYVDENFVPTERQSETGDGSPYSNGEALLPM